ncbi:hypothetical protein [Psychrobacter sp.]|uniref:hypothetical protein n=1 Tax=Psychrobacter sp. TaxID=56811 RepID=UPI003F9DFFEF
MKTITKIATALPALALLSACATTAPTTSETSSTTTDTPTTEQPSAAYDRMAPTPYTCTDDSMVMAKQSINKQQVMLNATLPAVEWDKQAIILNGQVNGEVASYTNNSNPEVVYAWHMKGNEAVLAMKWASGTEYNVTCRNSRDI